MPSIYDVAELFPGWSGSALTSDEHHPAQFLNSGETITLGANESGIFIPACDFKYEVDKVDTDNPNQDSRYLIWNILERLSDYIAFEQPEYKSISISESNINFFQSDLGNLRKKDYNISLWFKPLTQLELSENLDFNIDKTYEN